jgi:hypothetical protein
MTLPDFQPLIAADRPKHELIPITDRLAILAFLDDGCWCFRPLLDGEVVWGIDPWGWGSCELN